MRQIKILFVEDESSIRRELEQFLRRYALKGLCVASNGLEGLELFRTCKPDIIISDIKMPKMSGIEMVKSIKKINPEQSVIFTTAHSDSSFFMEAIELQVDGYLLKPIDLKLLDKKITEISERIALEKQYDLQKTILNEIAHFQSGMLVVLDKNMDILFLNDRALAYCGFETIEDAKLANYTIENKIVKLDDYFYPSKPDKRDWIKEIQKLESHKRIIALREADNKSIKTYIVDISYSKESEHIIVSMSEVTKIEEEKNIYKDRVYKDDLTQVYNRAMLNKQLDIEIKKASEKDHELSMIMMDIDHFKQINDLYGHSVGDEILVGLSDLVKSQIRTNDLFVRWGGEEFVLLLPDTGTIGASILAEDLRKLIKRHLFAKEVSLTCSFGVASMHGEEDMSLFKKVDAALYKAKLGGRDKVSIY